MYKNSRGRPGAVLAAAAVAQFVFALDMSVVNVALPAIRTALGFAPLNLSWIVHGYALTFGGLLLLGAAPATCTATVGCSCWAWPSSGCARWGADWRRSPGS